MKYLLLIIIAVVISSFTLINTLQSTEIKGNSYKVKINDTTEIVVQQMLDLETKSVVFYSSQLYVPACNTGECKMIEMTMFWDVYGNYFKYTVSQNTPLTKANHKLFTKSDYIKLHLILNNTKSKLKEFKISDLTEKQAGKRFKTDAKSGASIKFFGEPRIKGAIKTTYTLWHIANGTVSSKINKLSQTFIKKENLLVKSDMEIEKELEKIDIYNIIDTQILIESIENKNVEDKKLQKYFIKSTSVLSETNNDKAILITNLLIRKGYKYSKSDIKKIQFLQ